METVLFNFHDQILILTAFECLLFGLLITVSEIKHTQKSLFFIGFLLCHVVIPLHELIFWGTQFRHFVLDISPNLFLIGSIGYYLDGAFLFLFIRALAFSSFKLSKIDLIHLIPLAVYVITMFFSFYLLPTNEKHHLIATQHIAYSSPYIDLNLFNKLIRFGYAITCLILITKYQRQLQDQFANLSNINLVWLFFLVGSTGFLFFLDLIIAAVKSYGLYSNNFPMAQLHVLGVSSYHLTFFFVNLIIFLKFTRLQNMQMVTQSDGAKPPNTSTIPPIDIQNIEDKLKQEALFTQNDLTLDTLSKQLGLSSKRLSFIIKSHYDKNFYEFVNGFRIEKAKEMLTSETSKHQSITAIYLDVGFNSKSVFNTFFKKSVGVTPSAYRQQHKKGSHF